MDIFPQSTHVSCLIASIGRPVVPYRFCWLETIY